MNQNDFSKCMIWIGDTGATCHMTNSMQGFKFMKPTHCTMQAAFDSEPKTILTKGTWIGRQYHRHTDKKNFKKGDKVTMKNVMYVAGLKNNLYSITQAIDEGAKVSNEKDILILTFPNEEEMRFDYKMPSQNGYLMGAVINPLGEDIGTKFYKSKGVNINIFHRRCGHMNINDTKATAESLNIKLEGKLDICLHCARAKAKKKKISKEIGRTTFPIDHKLGIDITSCGCKSLGGNRYSNTIIDYGSNYMTCIFLKTKGKLSEALIPKLKELYILSPEKLKTIRLDNSGENDTLVKQMKKTGTKINLERTSRETPQQNGKIERGIATIWTMIKAMMDCAGIMGALANKLWAETFVTAIKLNNLRIRKAETKSPVEKWEGKLPI